MTETAACLDRARAEREPLRLSGLAKSRLEACHAAPRDWFLVASFDRFVQHPGRGSADACRPGICGPAMRGILRLHRLAAIVGGRSPFEPWLSAIHPAAGRDRLPRHEGVERDESRATAGTHGSLRQAASPRHRLLRTRPPWVTR